MLIGVWSTVLGRRILNSVVHEPDKRNVSLNQETDRQTDRQTDRCILPLDWFCSGPANWIAPVHTHMEWVWVLSQPHR